MNNKNNTEYQQINDRKLLNLLVYFKSSEPTQQWRTVRWLWFQNILMQKEQHFACMNKYSRLNFDKLVMMLVGTSFCGYKPISYSENAYIYAKKYETNSVEFSHNLCNHMWCFDRL